MNDIALIGSLVLLVIIVAVLALLGRGEAPPRLREEQPRPKPPPPNQSARLVEVLDEASPAAAPVVDAPAAPPQRQAKALARTETAQGEFAICIDERFGHIDCDRAGVVQGIKDRSAISQVTRTVETYTEAAKALADHKATVRGDERAGLTHALTSQSLKERAESESRLRTAETRAAVARLRLEEAKSEEQIALIDERRLARAKPGTPCGE
ncbi:MAG: hypothetical protein IV100_26505 [Myxococcales bacterium]|nr:hypothetical protein [Myxococcales bacterium]